MPLGNQAAINAGDIGILPESARPKEKEKEREDSGVKEETKEEELKVAGELRVKEKAREDKCGEVKGEKEEKE